MNEMLDAIEIKRMNEALDTIESNFQLWMGNNLVEPEHDYMFKQGVKDKLDGKVRGASELEDIGDIPCNETGYHQIMGRKICYEEDAEIQSRVGLEMLYMAGLYSEQFKFMHEKLSVIPRAFSVAEYGDWAHDFCRKGKFEDKDKKELVVSYTTYAPDILNKILMFYRKTHIGDHDHAKIKFVLEELVEVNLNKVLADPENFELGYYSFANKKNPKGLLRNIMLYELSAMLVIVKEGYLDDYVYDIVNHKMINKTVISKLKKETSGGKEMNDVNENVEVSEYFKKGVDAGQHYLDTGVISTQFHVPSDYIEGQIKSICGIYGVQDKDLSPLSDNDSEFYLGFRTILNEIESLSIIRRMYMEKGMSNDNKNKVYGMNGNPMFQNFKKDLLIDKIDHLIPGFDPATVAFNLIMQDDCDGTSAEVDEAVYRINQSMLADTSINNINAMRALNSILLGANNTLEYEFSNDGEAKDLIIPHLTAYEFGERKVVEIMNDIFIHYSPLYTESTDHVEGDMFKCARDNKIISDMLLLLSDMETSDTPFGDVLSLVANTDQIINVTKYKDKYLNIINSIIGDNVRSIEFTDRIGAGNIKIVLVYNQGENTFELAWIGDHNCGYNGIIGDNIWNFGNINRFNQNVGQGNWNNNNWGNSTTSNNWGNNNGGQGINVNASWNGLF